MRPLTQHHALEHSGAGKGESRQHFTAGSEGDVEAHPQHCSALKQASSVHIDPLDTDNRVDVAGAPTTRSMHCKESNTHSTFLTAETAQSDTNTHHNQNRDEVKDIVSAQRQRARNLQRKDVDRGRQVSTLSAAASIHSFIHPLIAVLHVCACCAESHQKQKLHVPSRDGAGTKPE